MRVSVPELRRHLAGVRRAGGGTMAAADDADRVDLRAGFEAWRQQTIAARLPSSVLVFLGSLAAVDVVEWLRYPARLPLVAGTAAVQVLCCLLLLVATHRRLVRPSLAAVATFAALTAAAAGYNALAHGATERIAVPFVCVMTAFAVVLIPTVLEQAALLAAVAASFVVGSRGGLSAEGASISAIGVLAGGGASILAAWFVARSSRTSFVQTRLQQEEAEIASVLLRVGERLQERLDRPGMLDEMNRLAVEVLGCEWSTTYVFCDDGQTLRLAASYGVPADRLDDSRLLHAPALMPLAQRAPMAEGLAELVNEEVALWWPDGRRRVMGRPSMLQAPILHENEPIGLFGVGVERPGHRFTARDRRLVRGIAHAAGVAIRNARLLADVKAASRLKSDFVATMSHELRTPINVIVGYLDMLGDPDIGSLNAVQGALARSTRDAALQLLELVNSTLELNRLESGQVAVQPVVFDLDDLVAEVVHELRPLVPVQVALDWHVAAEARTVGTDRPKLKTVLKNLVGNALKFTTAGMVEVTAEATGRMLVLRVRDTGAGIAPDDLPIVFEMFRQGRGAAGRGGGVGLGLHIVQRLTALLGGTVEATSTLGSGTTFVVRLPQAVAAVPEARSA